MIAMAAALIATVAGADDFYHGLAQGNPDLRSVTNAYTGSGVIQRGVGDSIDRYQGWADGNDDLFTRFDAPTDDHERPEIYPGLSGNPDL
jgi:hypothetical protein